MFSGVQESLQNAFEYRFHADQKLFCIDESEWTLF
jgi:hypothetical protein